MNIYNLYDELALEIDKKNIEKNAPMKDYTSFKVGGNAAILVKPSNVYELSYALKLVSDNNVPHIVIGNGSNLLVKDGGYKGVIIKMGEACAEIKTVENRIVAGAGALLSLIAREAQNNSLTGFEFAAGIPGTIGGAVFMNAGAYDGEISKVLETVEVITKDGASIKTLKCEELDLKYRHSKLQETGDIIINATISLKHGDKEAITTTMRDLGARRTEKQPLSYPSAGSFFKRPEGSYAGKLIEDAGLRGLTHGGAQVSALHAGFIINKGGATATEIIDLMEIVRATVFEKSGIMLQPEVKIIGE